MNPVSKEWRREPLYELDPELNELLRAELRRQQETLELIASENFASRAVLEATGSVLTNKYAEGYPGARYYGGCEVIDAVEQLAIDRCKELFGAEHVNVQPHSGSSANLAALFALLEPGDTLLAMELAHGGHLTHGLPLNLSGVIYNAVAYHVRRDTETIDYDEVARARPQHRPKLIICGYSSYPRTVDFAAFREIADECGALLLADIAHIAGLVAAGLHPNPVPYCDVVTSTTHKTLTGPRAGLIMCRKQFARAIDRAVFPGMQGGPLAHVVAAKAVCLRIARSEEFRRLQRQIVANAAALAEDAGRRRPAARLGRHRRAPRPRRPARHRPERPRVPAAARVGQHHRQPQRRALRRERHVGGRAACASARRRSARGASPKSRCARRRASFCAPWRPGESRRSSPRSARRCSTCSKASRSTSSSDRYRRA